MSQKLYNRYIIQYIMEYWGKGQGCWDDLRGSQEEEVRMCLRHGDAFRSGPVHGSKERNFISGCHMLGGLSLERKNLPSRPS